jgi:hypothetical protein
MPTIEENIAAAISGGDSDDAPGPTPVEAPGGPEDEPEPDAGTDAAEPADDAPEGATSYSEGALIEAIESGDPAALIAALGDKADDLLGSKAHASLRRKARENAEQLTKLEGTAAKLSAKYGDAIAVRKACEEGADNAFDMFADLLERTTGKPWNELMSWAAKAATGRVERLAGKQSEATKREATRKTAEAEVVTWIEGSIKGKPLGAVPGAAQLVFAKIRERVAAGVDTPAKAVPLVMADLKRQHEALTKLFSTAQPKPAKRAVAAIERESPKTSGSRRSKLEENIAWALGRSK